MADASRIRRSWDHVRRDRSARARGGNGGAAHDQQGALALIARSPLGGAALFVICAGLLAYEVWKLTQAIAGRGPEGGGGAKPMDRVSNAAGELVYLGFFAVAVSALSGRSGNSSGQARHAAAGVLGCHPPRSPTRCTSRAAPSMRHYPRDEGITAEIRRQRLERARAMLLA